MQRTILFLICLVLVALVGAFLVPGCRSRGGGGGASAWAFFTPQGGGTLTALAVHPMDSGILLAGTHGGLFRSQDSGSTWARVGPRLAGEEILRIQFNPSSPGTVYAATRRGGLHRSVDGGRTFAARNGDLPPGTPDRHVTALAVDPVQSMTLYLALAGQGVYRSTDGGGTWVLKVLGLTTSRVNDLGVDAQDTSGVYAATDQGVFGSRNRGDSWTGLGSPLDLHSILVHPAVAMLILAVGPDGVWRSPDRGKTWNRFENGLGSGPCPARGITYDPENPQDLYLSGLEGVWRARGGQNLWEEIHAGLGVERNRRVGPLAAVGQGPLVGPILHAGVAGEGYFQSRNGGVSWSHTGVGLDAVAVRAVAVSSSRADSVYLGTPGRVWRSLDGGKTWEDVSSTLEGQGRGVHDLWIDPRDDRRVLAATDGGVFYTGDGGGQWHASQGVVGVRALAVHASQGSYSLVLAVGEAGVYRSESGGTVFTLVAAGPDLVNLRDIAVDPTESKFAYAVRGDRGVLYSRNTGSSWNFGVVGLDRDRGYERIAVDARDPALLLLTARDGGVYRSEDSGLVWRPSSSGLPDPLSAEHLVMDPRTDPGRRGRTVVSVPGVGLYASPDAGRGWAPLHTGIFPPRILCVALALGTSDRVYAALPGGLLRHP